jgi:NAD(P)-dependent dehydrogenase (short-subunit alcohol dehydrogenase family)
LKQKLKNFKGLFIWTLMRQWQWSRGAGSGIGRALACRLVAAGARFVVCTDIDADAALETASLIGSKASAEALDVADQAAIEDLVTRVETAHGGIDLFVSNAGYALGGGLGSGYGSVAKHDGGAPFGRT